MTRLPHRYTAIQSSSRGRAHSASPIEQPRWQERALNIGADELYACLEWTLRDRPRSLGAAKRRYRQFCLSLISRLNCSAREIRT